MFDSHAHIMFPTLTDDRTAIISRARKAGLWGWLEIGVDIEGSRQAIALAEQEEGVYATVGVHPDDIAGLDENGWEEVAKLASHPKVKAIGEVGLDFYRDGKLEEQLPVLKRFIVLAREKNLPVVFHVRDGAQQSAHEELLKLLERYSSGERPHGVIHTYSGSLAQAKRYLDLGLYLSFSGVITFKNCGELLEVATMVPADKMLIETDSPFLAPEPHRGKQNEPAYVKLVAEKLGEIRGVSLEEIEKQTDANTRTLFLI
ncbi:MAG: TatD family hydrolase [Candidatus Colwellbacteria bacterium]|nr:TatD family hydrolase [Candidatus Colwellbacteria bacterium]